MYQICHTVSQFTISAVQMHVKGNTTYSTSQVTHTQHTCAKICSNPHITARSPLLVFIYSAMLIRSQSPIKSWHADNGSRISQNIIHLGFMDSTFKDAFVISKGRPQSEHIPEYKASFEGGYCKLTAEFIL